jgi:hypothetical protein
LDDDLNKEHVMTESSDRELEAMAGIAKSLADLDQETIARIMRWVSDRYKVVLPDRAGVAVPARPESAGAALASSVATTGNGSGKGLVLDQFTDVASFVHAAKPQTTADRALVVAYWFQQKEKQDDFGAQEINTALKHLGHGLDNITEVFNQLMRREPQLVIQTQKSGTSRQARKRYKVTVAGIQHIEEMLPTTK